MEKIFSGSYDANDVHFLLKPVSMDFVSVVEKEQRIQSGQSHYSEMLSVENLPSATYIKLFEQAMKLNEKRFAQDILRLAQIIIHNMEKRNCKEITLVSLARAGTPVGVLLKRSLELLSQNVCHYSISIIRGRGIDKLALHHILNQEGRDPQSFVFVDGWTGKGVIGRELKESLAHFYQTEGILLPAELYVVADLCGQADFSATSDDYLLPSSLLNAIISGLISRSVLNEKLVGPEDFHACVYYKQWEKEDISQWFIERIFGIIKQEIIGIPLRCPWQMTPISPTSEISEISQISEIFQIAEISQVIAQKEELSKKSCDFMSHCQEIFGVNDINHVKPGIGEATRVLLRRVPHLVIVREKNHPDTRHLESLAKEKSVPVIIDPVMPYAAAALIRTVTNTKEK